MWSLIGALFSAIVGFGSGATGMTQYIPNPFGIPDTAQLTPPPVTDPDAIQVSNGSCYVPQLDTTLTLKWPENFINLTDHRVQLNPNVWGSKPPVFSAGSECRNLALKEGDSIATTTNEREYFLVRQGVRIPSCKVDELAGPYNKYPSYKCVGESKPERMHRGSCVFSRGEYFDLRKVAEIPQAAGQPLEIFWVPFSHNADCIDDVNSNCGPDENRDKINLQDYIYVLKSREAFDPTQLKDCKALFDSGPTNEGACSHYFDVYMARDTYDKFQSPVPKGDRRYYEYEYFKQNVENCKEISTFTPIVDIQGSVIPEQFIATPFSPFYTGTARAISPATPDEISNYQYFVKSNPVIQIEKTSLFITTSSATAKFTPCPIGFTDTQTSSCFSPVGTIGFQKDGNTITFQVYSRGDTPQTFYLKDKSGNDSKLYTYTLTEDEPPSNEKHSPSLQLNQLKFKTSNHWSWATPWCKPAIYLYPQSPMNLNVKVAFPNGTMTYSKPPYSQNGWNVLADPSGSLRIKNRESGIEEDHPYLYYEADIYGVHIPKEGFVWKQNELVTRIPQLLTTIGFNEKEIADFNEYWLPRLKDRPYYFVTLLPETQINENENLLLTTYNLQPLTPDTLIRSRVIFEGLDAPVSVSPVTIPSHTRSGFTVTDWGGTIIGKSCEDLSIK